ncbi:Lysyl-tRNA synthetase [Candidatus Johnevansia muelleri]|uniref:Lysine--tRNA ligase n=1 Tax=Candidatus Johnevansia muelleri TaxID=1495769 RepID=A0A078KIG3_9GAMM|nr:Lysyl-tRNA synthetase [Candidatus Evansia muelleri]
MIIKNNINSENYLINIRKKKLFKLREKYNNLGISVFPNDFRRDNFAYFLQKKYLNKTKLELIKLNYFVSVAGRIMRKRGPFIIIQDVTGQIQIYLKKNLDNLEEIKNWDIGDIIYAYGIINKSNMGDLYILVTKTKLLTKSLRSLPDKYHGFIDKESRYRQRYVDLIMNVNTRKLFYIRTSIIIAIREFLFNLEFLEVETPILQNIPGGAFSRPFITHHNALNSDMYLRISPELYLKRLVIGGLERVFEINRNFRNEGLSTIHNPEFTMVEFYWAFANYYDLIKLTENLICYVAKKTLGYTIISLNYDNKKIVLDLTEPFNILTMRQSILVYGIKYNIYDSDIVSLETIKLLAKKLNIIININWGMGKILNEIFSLIVEHKIIKPTFITEYPVEISPLARCNDKNPEFCDRFELFIIGHELANGYSELNDPEEQSNRFKTQLIEKSDGNLESMFYDIDYINALEYGMPPTAGEGIGIDRLVMLLTNSVSIRDVLFFPIMRNNKFI